MDFKLTPSIQNKISDGVLKRSELRELKAEAAKTPDKQDDQAVAQLGAHFKDKATVNLFDFKLADNVEVKFPLFKCEDDITAPSVQELAAGKEVLSVGQEGPAVAELKRALNELGYQLPVEPGRQDLQVYGKGSMAQLLKFQQDYGIAPHKGPDGKPDGLIGKGTWELLQKKLSEARSLRANLAAAGNTETSNNPRYSNCYNGVYRAAIEAYGQQLADQIFPANLGAHAYQAKQALRNNPHFKEIKVAEADLDKLPQGAIVVWGNNPAAYDGVNQGYLSGHISIASGDGHEYSDHKEKQMQPHYARGGHTVFLPVPRRTPAPKVATPKPAPMSPPMGPPAPVKLVPVQADKG